METQKAEIMLNLAVSTPEEVREQTEDLNIGYDRETQTWELIVTFSGDLEEAVKKWYPAVQVRVLEDGFAILRVPQDLVESVIALDEIEYAEKPKRLYFALNQAKAVSCFLPLQRTGAFGAGNGLTGNGVLLGVIDSGIDYFHEAFLKEDGTTKILYLYDQTDGTVYKKEELDERIRSARSETFKTSERSERLGNSGTLANRSSLDISGHGTAVAGIASELAPDCGLIVVRLAAAEPGGFPRTTQVMDGIDFVIKKAQELQRPVAVNLSFGNTYGSHDGSGLFERYIDRMAERGRSVFVIGMGNEGSAAGHASGQLEHTEKRAPYRSQDREQEREREQEADKEVKRKRNHVVDLSVGPSETGFSVQLWKYYEDDVNLYLTGPSGTVTEMISRRSGAYRLDMGNTEVLVYYGEPGPFQEMQEVFLEFLPAGAGRRPGSASYVESGIWKFTLEPVSVAVGRYDFWLPSSGALGRSTRFLRPDPDLTLTIPSTARRPVSVAAYDDSLRVYAPFSGRGNPDEKTWFKPDLAAPGVGVMAPKAGGGYEAVTGTSFAAPFVTAAAALMMEWGIVLGNDPYLYGDKVKAYLRKGAKKLPGGQGVPDVKTGFGALCAADSIPK